MKKPEIWAHRGASGYCPENTLPAFEKALEMGAQGIELDIQLTKDEKIVVIHDEWINRTSDGEGWVKDYTLEELRRYNYNKNFPELGHVDIPTMEEVFALIRPTDLIINIELKTGIVFYDRLEERILELTKRMGMEDRVIYSSFNHYSIKKIHELDPKAQVGFLFSGRNNGYGGVRGKARNVNALHPALYYLQYPGFVQQCKERGIKINTWTVNEPEYMKLCCEAGVDAIITNYPDLALEVAAGVAGIEPKTECSAKKHGEVRRQGGKEAQMTERTQKKNILPEGLAFREANFEERMRKEVQPWLKNQVKDGYFRSWDGSRIHYLSAVHPRERAGGGVLPRLL